MSIDGGSSNESCFRNCIDGDNTTAPPPPISKHQDLLNQYAPVKSSVPHNVLSAKRSHNRQVILSKRRIGKGRYAVSDDDNMESPPPSTRRTLDGATPRKHPKKPSRQASESSFASERSSVKSKSSKSLTEPGQIMDDPKPEVDEFELRTTIEETIKSMQIVPDHVLQLAVNETFQNMKMNKQQKNNFPPIVKTTIERHMPPDEIRKFYQQDDLLSDQQYTKVKGYLLNTTALATTALASLHIDKIGTKYLHEKMKDFVSSPANRSSFDEVGQYIKGTIFDSPVFSIGSSIAGVFREAHEQEMNEKKNLATIDEEDVDFRDDRMTTPIASMESTLKDFKQRNGGILNSMPPSLLKKKPTTETS